MMEDSKKCPVRMKVLGTKATKKGKFALLVTKTTELERVRRERGRGPEKKIR